ncbi:MAG: HigA family addiction module antitoxin [Candidatus Dechloromonas phosphoritropha]
MTATIHHPGEILANQLKALGVTPTELARQLQVPANRITQIVNGKRAITGDSALRLAHWFGNAPEYWITLQARHDLEVVKIHTGREIDELPTRLHRSAQPTKRHEKHAQVRAV